MLTATPILSVGMPEGRWCQTIGKNTPQCRWRRRYGFNVPLPPREVPGWPNPSTYLDTPQIYVRRSELGEPGELGLDFPGISDLKNAVKGVAKVAKSIYYVGIGTALIVVSLFAWRVVDVLFGIVE